MLIHRSVAEYLNLLILGRTDSWVVWSTIVLSYFFFFFSSRRRHTRSDRDWSSDVCSSDLHAAGRFPLPTTEEWREGAGCFRDGGSVQVRPLSNPAPFPA